MDVTVLLDHQEHQLCADTGCSLEDLLGAMDDRGWIERKSQGNPCCQRDLMMKDIISSSNSYLKPEVIPLDDPRTS